MSNQYYEQLLEQTYEKVADMSVDKFMSMCEEYNMEVSVIDSFAQRCGKQCMQISLTIQTSCGLMNNYVNSIKLYKYSL